jgi:hypothetical protein
MGFIEIKKIKIYDTIKNSYRVGKKLLDTQERLPQILKRMRESLVMLGSVPNPIFPVL